VTGVRTPRVPGLRTSVQRGAAFVAVAALVATLLSPTQLFNASTGLVVAMVMLSLVVLVGYSGQISLCQYTFVGVGASTMGKFFASGSPLGLVAATLVAAAFGALVALPALRLRDIYLALVTVAFALFGERLLFDHPKVFDRGATLTLERPSLLGIDLDSETTMFVFLAVCFAAMAVLVLAVRRGPLGRRLAAMNDSPSACMTLGLNLIRTKVTVFAISAGMAGFAGALFGMLRTSVSANDFVLLVSLNTFLLAMIGGITTITGALIGGMVLPFLDSELQGVFIGLGAIVISRLPNGFAGILYGVPDRLRRLPQSRPAAAADAVAPDTGAALEGAPA
jgi:branched-chain amino acid transport system permease protein